MEIRRESHHSGKQPQIWVLQKRAWHCIWSFKKTLPVLHFLFSETMCNSALGLLLRSHFTAVHLVLSESVHRGPGIPAEGAAHSDSGGAQGRTPGVDIAVTLPHSLPAHIDSAHSTSPTCQRWQELASKQLSKFTSDFAVFKHRQPCPLHQCACTFGFRQHSSHISTIFVWGELCLQLNQKNVTCWLYFCASRLEHVFNLASCWVCFTKRSFIHLTIMESS